MLSNVILAIATGSAFLLSFICIANPGKSNDAGSRWLGIFLFCFALGLLSDVLTAFDLAAEYVHVIIFSEISRFAIAPSLYLSIAYYSRPTRGSYPGEMLHFLPLILFAMNCLPFFIPDFSGPMLTNRIASPDATRFVALGMSVVIKVQMIVYWAAAYILISGHQKNIGSVFSSLNSIDLQWLKYFLIAVLLAMVVWLNQTLIHIDWLNNFSAPGYLVAVYMLSYFALKQRELYPFEAAAVVQIEDIMTQKGVTKERLAAGELETLASRLAALMEQDKCYLDQELSLPHLAKKMELTCHELSYLLNKQVGMSFFEYINRYRVDEAKLLLVSDRHQHLSMLGIAYEAGFSSKTTFNTAFKTFTGQSPSQFKKSAGLDESLAASQT